MGLFRDPDWRDHLSDLIGALIGAAAVVAGVVLGTRRRK